MLSELVPESSADLLIQALGDVDWRGRKEAVRGGVELTDRLHLFPRLMEAVAPDENVGLRTGALEGLGNLVAGATPYLLAALPPSTTTRKFLVEALGETGDQGAVEVLVKETRDPDPNVRNASLLALSRLGGPKAEEVLRLELQGSDRFAITAAL